MRQHKLMMLLHDSKTPVHMNELIAALGVSERTVRESIRQLGQAGERHGYCIRMIRNQGYALEVTDPERFRSYMANETAEEHRIDLNDRSARQQQVLFCLLQTQDYVPMDRLADEMGISRSTLLADLKEVEERLAVFRLNLTRRAHYGIRVEGNEENFRKAFSHYVLQSEQPVEQSREFYDFSRNLDKDRLKNHLLHVLRTKELKISDVFLNNLVTHLLILLYRISKHNHIVLGQTSLPQPEALYRDIAEELAAWIDEHLNMTLPEDEINYLALHISGKTIVEHVSEQSKLQLRRGILEILSQLDQEFLTGFSKDDDLQNALLLHMFPLLNRLYYNLQLSNPLVEDVYSQYANVFLISFRFAEFIEARYGFKMSRDEAGYVALHFATHLERMKQSRLEQLKRIVVICSSGAGSAHLIRLRLEALFPKASVITASVNEIADIMKQPVDLILTTVPLEQEFQDMADKPVIHIKNWLDDQEIQRIRETVSLQMATVQTSYKLLDFKELFRKELFHVTEGGDYMQLLQNRCEEIVSKGYAADDFPEQVLTRESKFTTIYKNGVAGPHPMRMGAIKDCINVTVLKRPILHEGKPVQLIFLINLRPGQLFLHKEISKLLLIFMEKEESRSRILQAGTYEQFIKEIESLI